MQIKEIQINNFGKLEDKNIELTNGINVIYGENESGKSTLLKFITSIFYGISKNKNGKRISDYDKYLPWNDKEFSGKIKYELDNKEEYEVYRNFAKKNPQILDKLGNDITKQYDIDKTSGSKFFEEQTKVDESLFDMSMVIMQQEVKFDEKKQNALIQKVSNIMSTGEDDVSYKEILAKLNKIQGEEIGTEKSPTKPLYLTRQKIQELNLKKKELEQILPRRYELDDKKEELEKELSQFEIELEILQKIQNMQKDIKIEEEKINVNINSKREIENKKKEEEENLESIKTKNITKKSFKLLYIIPILLTIFSVILFVLKQKIFSVIGLALAIIVICTIFLLKLNEKKKYNNIKNQEKEEKSKIRNKIDILENEIKEKEKIISEKQNELEAKKKLKEQEIKTKFYKYENIEELFKEDIENSNLINEQKMINDVKLELKQIEIEKDEIVKKSEVFTQIEEEIENLEEKLTELLDYNTSINIAKDALEKAYMSLRENVTPKFTLNLQKTIKNITDGKYNTIKINEENELMVETQNGSFVEADVLSIGTIDQLYLSLRISSIGELAKENMPIILDETFAYFDTERLKNILNFLNTEYKNRQILILTCTNREIESLEELNISYNKIEL